MSPAHPPGGRPRVGIVGFFGWGNFGDELFVRAHHQFLAPRFEVVQLHDLQKKPYFSGPVEEAVGSVDAIVIGGGDLIVPWDLSGLYWKREYLERPVFLTSIGVPRWGGYSNEVIRALRSFVQHPNVRFISARDIPSRDWIVSHLAPEVPVEFAPDMVCSLDLPAAAPEDARVLGVVTRMRRGGRDNLYWLDRLCERAAGLGYQVDHLVLGTGDVGRQDEEAASALAFPTRTMVRSEDLSELCAAIGRCTALASMKFHGSVVAAMYGVPSIVLSATDKSKNFMTMIERPDLLSGLTDPQLPSRLSPYMARIPRQTRQWLRERSAAGMAGLVDQIGAVVGR